MTTSRDLHGPKAPVPGPWGLLTPAGNRQVYPTSNLSDGLATTATFRLTEVIAEDTPYLLLVIANHSLISNVVDTVTVGVAYDYKYGSGAWTAGGGEPNGINTVPNNQAYFPDGATTRALPPKTYAHLILTGPFKRGDEIGIRLKPSVDALGKKWPAGNHLNRRFDGVIAGDALATPNYLAGFAYTAANCFTPVGLYAAAADKPAVVVLADSIGDGSGASGYSFEGWVYEKFNGQMGFQRLCCPGERLSTFIDATVEPVRPLLACMAPTIIEGYGANDFNNSATTAVVQADKIKLWGTYYSLGRAVISHTITPNTTGTSGSQTNHANTAARLAYNAWLLDGAPLLNGAAAATGSSASGTLRAGMRGHPLYKVWDMAGAVSDADGKWLPSYFGDGIHPNGAGHTAMAAVGSLSDILNYAQAAARH